MKIQNLPDAHFEALKDVTRLAWLLNFEAVATVATLDSAVAKDVR